MPRKIWSGPVLPPPKFPGVAMESCLQPRHTEFRIIIEFPVPVPVYRLSVCPVSAGRGPKTEGPISPRLVRTPHGSTPSPGAEQRRGQWVMWFLARDICVSFQLKK
jgi:hypothetical protein